MYISYQNKNTVYGPSKSECDTELSNFQPTSVIKYGVRWNDRDGKNEKVQVGYAKEGSLVATVRGRYQKSCVW